MRRTITTALSALGLGLLATGCEKLPVSSDTEPPTVEVNSPSANSTHTDSIIISVDARDNVGVAKVEIFFAGRVLPVARDTVARDPQKRSRLLPPPRCH